MTNQDPNPNRNQRPQARVSTEDLVSTEALVSMLRDDARFEPPAQSLAQARSIGARVAARYMAGTRNSGNPLAMVGAVLDRAQAMVGAWLVPTPGAALAQLRDDRGSEVLTATIAAHSLSLRAERTLAQDGLVRLVGDILRADGTPVRAGISIIDEAARVVLYEETDALGMFAIRLPDDAYEIVIQPRESATIAEEHPVVLPLARRKSP